jgi:hypothetical protein
VQAVSALDDDWELDNDSPTALFKPKLKVINGSGSAFPLTTFGHIKMNAEERNYIIKGLLPRSGLAVVWGPPKSRKLLVHGHPSTCCTELGVSRAKGRTGKRRIRRLRRT